jgi:hypothetical protein
MLPTITRRPTTFAPRPRPRPLTDEATEAFMSLAARLDAELRARGRRR